MVGDRFGGAHMIMLKLSDNIRQYTYNWICNHLSLIKKPSTLLDIGTRESKFAAYMSSQGYKVTSIERDTKFIDLQNKYEKEFDTKYEILTTDLLDLPDEPKYDLVTAIYSLQHNIEKDIHCYEKAAKLCNQYLYIINEFKSEKEELKLGRNDGDMRVYSLDQVWERIVEPVRKAHQIKNLKMELAKFDFPKQTIEKVSNLEEANTILLRIEF
jgi:hypothetical protein